MVGDRVSQTLDSLAYEPGDYLTAKGSWQPLSSGRYAGELKSQIADNVPWDKIVYTMMTADGRLLDNGATGYLLRDAGMRPLAPSVRAD